MSTFVREPTLRRATGALVALLAIAVLGSLSDRAPRGDAIPAAEASVDVYRGLGAWVDVYDGSAWADPAGAVSSMAARGVRTLFLQTSNFSRGSSFVFPDGVAAFLDAAHARGVSVVAWYLPGFDHPNRDFRRARAAIRYRTSSGNRFDSFAMDIESAAVRDVALRTERLLEVSRRLRMAVGSAYPLGAIVPAPLGADPTSWPGFPYRELASLYDVFLPMTYFTWRVSGPSAVAAYTSETIGAIRARTGSADVPVNVIGGIAGDATGAETRAFAVAVRDGGAVGAGFYTFPLTTEAEWRALTAAGRIPSGG